MQIDHTGKHACYGFPYFSICLCHNIYIELTKGDAHLINFDVRFNSIVWPDSLCFSVHAHVL